MVQGGLALGPMVAGAEPLLGPRMEVSPVVATPTVPREAVARWVEVEAPAALPPGEQEGTTAVVAMAAVAGAASVVDFLEVAATVTVGAVGVVQMVGAVASVGFQMERQEGTRAVAAMAAVLGVLLVVESMATAAMVTVGAVEVRTEGVAASEGLQQAASAAKMEGEVMPALARRVAAGLAGVHGVQVKVMLAETRVVVVEAVQVAARATAPLAVVEAAEERPLAAQVEGTAVVGTAGLEAGRRAVAALVDAKEASQVVALVKEMTTRS